MKRIVTFIALGAALIGPTIASSGKALVERRHWAVGQWTIVIDLADGSFRATGVFRGNHTGPCTSLITGTMNPADLSIIDAEGAITTANGDLVYVGLGPDGELAMSGGTGRFESITGSVSVVEQWNLVVTVDEVTQTMTMSYSARVEGTITY